MDADFCLEYSDVIIIIASACVFQLLNVLASHYELIPTSRVSAEKRLVWFNVLMSLLHALFVSAVVLIELLYNKSEFYLPENIGGPSGTFARISIFITFGYFIYDFVEYLRYFKLSKSIAIIFHHILMFIGYYTIAIRLQHLNVIIVVFVAEINTVFLHIRRLMRLAKVSENTMLYRIIVALNIITFIFLRFPIFAWISLYYYWYTNFTETAVRVWAMIAASSMTFFNLLLFAQIISTDCIGKLRKKTE